MRVKSGIDTSADPTVSKTIPFKTDATEEKNTGYTWETFFEHTSNDYAAKCPVKDCNIMAADCSGILKKQEKLTSGVKELVQMLDYKGDPSVCACKAGIKSDKSEFTS
jgi:hypothetical protein